MTDLSLPVVLPRTLDYCPESRLLIKVDGVTPPVRTTFSFEEMDGGDSGRDLRRQLNPTFVYPFSR